MHAFVWSLAGFPIGTKNPRVRLSSWILINWFNSLVNTVVSSVFWSSCLTPSGPDIFLYFGFTTANLTLVVATCFSNTVALTRGKPSLNLFWGNERACQYVSLCLTSFKTQYFFFDPYRGILMNHKCQQVLLVVKCLDLQILISWALPASFVDQNVHRQLFCEAGCSSLIITKFVLYIGIGVLIHQKWLKYY